ncbi:pimeloyl-ACP methyl ester carboxylesterase [Paenibacillus taihuensis]|uniref:Pimeloyl-ACP methyl ester carboxylesterase n=1 Tax=Paenibacillus taihuensis TaxID=1156355 RepID=A0A3D9SK28_9BACL|nr:alpha/beta hydrolase [Paenibacillus taihuensis]REE90653.1 pimeloyl-ACP methyl ester carboxylesterase [Paenibacillus taihuensis]
MPFTRINQENLYYEYHRASGTEHAAETIVMIHSLGTDLSIWNWTIPYLQSRYHILVYDVRGHGENQPLGEDDDMTWRQLCDDLAGLLAHLHIGRFHLVGHGMGGYIGLEFVREYPGRALTLCLLSVPLYYPVTVMPILSGDRTQTVLESNSIMPVAERLLSAACHRVTPDKQELLYETYRKVNFRRYVQIRDRITAYIAAQQIGPVELPVLFLGGEYDRLFPPSVLALGTILLQNYRFLVVPDAANAVQLDQPAIVAQWIDEHIRKAAEAPEIQVVEKLSAHMQNQIKDFVEQVRQQNESTTTLEVEVMGNFRVLVNRQVVAGEWNQRYAKRLLVYLLFHPSVTREQLCDVLWPEAELSKAKNRLRVSLSYLKSLLDKHTGGANPLLVADREYIHLRGNIKCDLQDLLEKLQATAAEPNTKRKALLSRDILDKTAYSLATGIFDNWLLAIIEKVEHKLEELARWTVEYYEQNNDRRQSERYKKFIDRFV